MALIAFEGFDHYNTITDVQQRSGALQWTAVNASPGTMTIVRPGRGGYGACLQFYGDIYSVLTASFNVNLAAGFFGFAMTFTQSTALVGIMLIDPLASNTVQTYVVFTASTGTIQLYNNVPTLSGGPGNYGYGTPVASSAPNAFNASVWSFIEIGAVISSSAGSLSVQVNGVTVVSFSGKTQQSANASFGGVAFRPNAYTGPYTNLSLDDFRVNDTTIGPGTYPCNSFLGDLRVATLFPIANVETGWTPLANSNWQEVSETAFDGDTSYNSATSLGAEDLFTLGALSGTISNVIGVQLTGAYRQTDASAHTISQQLVTGGTEYTGTAHTLSVDYQFLSDLYAVNPVSGASWTVDEINAIEAGYKALT